MRRKKVVNNLSVKQSILNIITTGIDRNKNHIFMINLLTGGKNGELIQYKVPEDKTLFLEDIKDKKIIFFNGHSFDIPFIKKAIEYEGEIKEELDIYSFLKNYKFKRLPDYKYKTAFEEITKDKLDELSGREIVKLIKDYETQKVESSNKTTDNTKESEDLLNKIYEQGEKHSLNLLKLYDALKIRIEAKSIPLSIFGRKLILFPYSFSEDKDYFNIKLLNYGDKLPMNYQLKTFEFYSKEEQYFLKFRKTEGLLEEKTTGICVITEFNYVDQEYRRLKKGLIPIYVEDYLVHNIRKVVELSLEEIGGGEWKK